MILHDAEYERWYWDRENIRKCFGNGLPNSISNSNRGEPEDEWPFFDDPLVPKDTFLHFHEAFIQAVIDSPVDNLGTYTMGWQL